jgi:hypothetical protein
MIEISYEGKSLPIGQAHALRAMLESRSHASLPRSRVFSTPRDAYRPVDIQQRRHHRRVGVWCASICGVTRKTRADCEKATNMKWDDAKKVRVKK